MSADGVDRRTALAVPLLLVTPVPASAETRQTAEAALLDFLHAFENCDLPRMEAAFAPDATYFDRAPTAEVDTLEPYRRGRGMPPGMRKIATELPKSKPGPPYHRVQPADLLIQSAGEVAVCTFHLEADDSLGRRTVVLQRWPAGWKIIHIHASNIQRRA